MAFFEHSPLSVMKFNLAMRELGECLRHHDAAGAVRAAQQVLARTEQIRDPRLEAFAFSNASSAYSLAGDLARAYELMVEALSRWESLFGPENSEVITAIAKLAQVCHDAGRWDEALAYHERSLASVQAGHVAPGIAATVMNNFADHLKARQDWVRAENLLRRALELGGEDGRCERLKNLADVLAELGRFDEAEAMYRSALQGFERMWSSDHVLVGVVLGSLGQLELTRIRNVPFAELRMTVAKRAEEILQRARVIFATQLGERHWMTAITTSQLAVAVAEGGDGARALPLLQSACAIAGDALGPSHREVRKLRGSLAHLLSSLGRFADATRILEAVIADHTHGDDFSHALCLYELALARLYTGMPAEDVLADAERASEQAYRVITEQLGGLAHAPEEARRATARLAGTAINIHVSLHADHFRDSEKACRDAFLALQRFKGTVLEASLAPAGHDREAPQQRYAIHAKLRACHEALVDAYFSPRDPTWTARLAKLDNDKRAIENAIAESFGSPRSEVSALTVEAIQAAMPPGSALVEYALDIPLRRPSDGEHTGGIERSWDFAAARLVAYVLRRDAGPVLFELGPAAQIDGAVELARDAMAQRRDARAALERLERLVFRPLRSALGDARIVLVAPIDALSNIPFAALVAEDGRYLCETYAFQYLSWGRDLLRLQRAAPAREPALVIAAPDFGAPEVGVPSQLRFAPLPGTLEEAREVAALWPAARLRTGANATKRELFACHGPIVLHVATHGFAPDDRARTIAGSARDVVVPAHTASPTVGDEVATGDLRHLLGTGLALAGADSGTPARTLLTAMEAAYLDLQGTQLVVLSACKTGVGIAEGGELYSMRRAMLVAGARSVVSSLWSVDDETTKLLITHLHRGLREGLSRVEALRQAQLSIARSKRSHPFFWAAFVSTGDCGPIDQRIVETAFHPPPAPPPPVPKPTHASTYFTGLDATTLRAECLANVPELAKIIQAEVNGAARIELRMRAMGMRGFDGLGELPPAVRNELAHIRDWLGATAIGSFFEQHAAAARTPRDVRGLGLLLEAAIEAAEKLPITYRRRDPVDPKTMSSDEILCARCGEVSTRFLKFCLYCNALLPHRNA